MEGRKKLPADPTQSGFGPLIGRFGYKTGTFTVVVPGQGAAPQPGTASDTVVGTVYTAFHFTLIQLVPAPEIITPPAADQL